MTRRTHVVAVAGAAALTALLSPIPLPASASIAGRERISIDTAWRFQKGDGPGATVARETLLPWLLPTSNGLISNCQNLRECRALPGSAVLSCIGSGGWICDVLRVAAVVVGSVLILPSITTTRASAATPQGVDLSTYIRIGRYDLPEPTRTLAASQQPARAGSLWRHLQLGHRHAVRCRRRRHVRRSGVARRAS